MGSCVWFLALISNGMILTESARGCVKGGGLLHSIWVFISSWGDLWGSGGREALIVRFDGAESG